MADDHTRAMTIIERAPNSAMSPVVAGVMQRLTENPDPQTLAQLLAVQKDWEANEARKSYSAALVALKRDLPTVIARDAKVNFTTAKGQTSYTHASLAAVMSAITEPLTQHGFSLAWKPHTTEKGVSVTCRLTHAAGHFEEATISAPIDTSGNKSTTQGVMSTITMLSRYTALNMLGIATADMEEPKPEAPAPDSIDSAANLSAVGWLQGKRIRREDAEAFIGRKVPQWTRADLERIKVWGKLPRDPGTGEIVPPAGDA